VPVLLVAIAALLVWLVVKNSSQGQESSGSANYAGSDYSPSDWLPTTPPGGSISEYSPAWDGTIYVPGLGDVHGHGPIAFDLLNNLAMGIEPPLAGPRPGESPYGGNY
jgi:hypothetical protein